MSTDSGDAPVRVGDYSWIATAVMTGGDWNATAYFQTYDWFMQSNPTYEAQINQFDKRTTIGGRYDSSVISDPASSSIAATRSATS